MNELSTLITAHPDAAIGALVGVGLTVLWHIFRRIERLVRSVALMAIAGGGLAAGGSAAAGHPSLATAAQFVSNVLHLH